ncbi:MAG TPA: hypothetical protein VKA78_17640 [Pyrinomonadaceae bacterium]|nr:hypothetical protein [Pyrinomonadaceae bacterium]
MISLTRIYFLQIENVLKTNEGRLGLKMLVLRVIPGDQGVKANERYHRFESSGKEIWAYKEVQDHED